MASFKNILGVYLDAKYFSDALYAIAIQDPIDNLYHQQNINKLNSIMLEYNTTLMTYNLSLDQQKKTELATQLTDMKKTYDDLYSLVVAKSTEPYTRNEQPVLVPSTEAISI